MRHWLGGDLTTKEGIRLMEKAARDLLYSESPNWLNRSRIELMDSLLKNTPIVEGPLLEIGAGSGHAIEKLSKYGPVDAIDVAPESWPLIQQKPVRNLYTSAIPNDKIEENYSAIVGLEVLEHIKDDKLALQWLVDHLMPGGLLLLSVPAYSWLWGPHDIANHHFRRYTRSRLLKLLPSNLELVRSGYFMTALFPLAAIARLCYNAKNKTTEQGSMPIKQKSSLPYVVDLTFGKIMSVEAYLAGKGISCPYGMTIYLLARKPYHN